VLAPNLLSTNHHIEQKECGITKCFKNTSIGKLARSAYFSILAYIG